MLKDRLMTDLKSAMLSGDRQRVSVFQMIKSALLNTEIELKARETGLTDEQVIAVLTKEAKKREEAASMYKQAGSLDRAAAEQAEADIIKEYLPEQMSNDELKTIVQDAISTVQAKSMQDMGKVIGVVKAKTGGQADGGRIAAQVKELLSI